METGIMTVLGPVPPETLGVTDVHSHVWIDRVLGTDPDAPCLTDMALQASGLAEYAAVGAEASSVASPAVVGETRISLPCLLMQPACRSSHAQAFIFGATTAWTRSCGG